MLSFSFPSLPQPGDLVQSRCGLERWHEQAAAEADPTLGAFASDFAADPGGQALLEALFGNSPYLAQSAILEIAFMRTLAEQGCTATFEHLLKDMQTAGVGDTDTARLMSRLRVAKRRAALLIAIADIGSLWSVEQVTYALSTFAEAALRLTCRHLLRESAAAGRLALPDPVNDPERGSGLVVLAVGKFGSRELNYSSDIDLIIAYDETLARAPKPDTLQQTFVRLARGVVRIMEERTRDGYVFRTDLRLRPDPGATPPAISVAAAEAYYGSVGQNWERAALIRSRQVAGDPAAGAALAVVLRSFIWRRNLDFAAIQDIHSIKRQINAHKGHHNLAVDGHDIKVGRGGIREVEFFAQTQQLIYGGREPDLRAPATCAALAALAAAGKIAAETSEELSGSYYYLRRVEHRIQMIDDHQTHRLPSDPEGLARLAVFLGYPDADAFRRELLFHLGRVEDHYADLFEEAPSLSQTGNLVFTGADADPGTVETLIGLGYANPSAIISTIAGWHHGRYHCTRSARARELLTELVPALLTAFARTPNPDGTLLDFDRFLRQLPTGVQLFSLFCANPRLLDLVAEVMGLAPQLAVTLSRMPAVFDVLLRPDVFDRLPGLDDLTRSAATALTDARDFEDVMLDLRRWNNEQKFVAGVQILRGITDGDRCGPYLADVAQTVLLTLLERVKAEFAERHGTFPGGDVAILTMGKLGGRQFSIGSDLDLILVYTTPTGMIASDGRRPLAPADYYARLTKRLIAGLTAPTREGVLYDTDMRLRPSGHAGPIAVSLGAFVQYHDHEAWTWEHMALTRARAIGGSPLYNRLLERAIRVVLIRPRDTTVLLHDVADMRTRVDKEFGSSNPWDVKYARGGVMDINFIAQYYQLLHAHDRPSLLAANTVDALGNLTKAGLLDLTTATELITAQRVWRRIQGFLRLTTETGQVTTETIPAPLLGGLARAIDPSAAAPGVPTPTPARLEEQVRRIAARAYGHYQRLIEAPARVQGRPAG